MKWAGVAVAVGIVVAGVLLVTNNWTPGLEFGVDSRAYWQASPTHPYGLTVGERGAYLYSPAFAQALAPLRVLPLPAFVALWSALSLAALLWLCRRRTPLALAFLPVSVELMHGNIHILLAVVAVAGLRYPILWALPLLTKVTPGVGLVWFVVRQEWRHLAVALGATAAIALVSVAIAPAAWVEWLALLRGASPDPTLIPRVAAGCCIVALGALRGRREAVPVGMLVAMPVIWPTSWALLVALVPLSQELALKPGRVGRSVAVVQRPA